ncbi:MAG: HAD family phosphatase [Acidimicrobiales bacterium]|nr:HAD family phosphatase [Acidimicrobiales bacterium]
MVQNLRGAIFDYGGVMSYSPLWRTQILADEMGVPADVFSKIIFFGESDSVSLNPWHEAECGRQPLNDEFAQLMQKRLTSYGATFDLDIFIRWVSEAINEPDPVMVQTVKELRETGVPVALLTNAVREFRTVIESTLPIYELFDVIVDSSEVGLRKPDSRIYELTASRLNLLPADCLMVDDLVENVNGANDVGMTGLLFSDSEKTAIEIRNFFTI